MQKEQEDLADLVNQLKDEYGNGGNTTEPDNPPTPPVKDETLADIVDKVQDTNKTIEDANGNKITIPGEFKVVPNSPEGTDASEKVDYTYNGDGTPAVQDGIVIEDNEGNQFVWIPVGEIKNKDNTTTTIQLARYTFNTGSSEDGSVKETKTDGSLLKTGSSSSHGFLEEDASSTDYENTKAKNIEEFKTKAKTNGGYYLARYEASKGTGDKVKSKSAAVWTDITQPVAATKAREMYTSTSFESDLVNSYAWDTAIVFIQTYSGDNDYSKEVGPTFSSSLVNTGTNGDKRCNIYDMASNTREWTTETYTDADTPCTHRGGLYRHSSYYTASRTNRATSYSYDNLSFRPLLYVK